MAHNRGVVVGYGNSRHRFSFSRSLYLNCIIAFARVDERLPTRRGSLWSAETEHEKKGTRLTCLCPKISERVPLSVGSGSEMIGSDQDRVSDEVARR